MLFFRNNLDLKTFSLLKKMQPLNLLKKAIVESQIFVSLCGTGLAVFFMMEQRVFRWPTVILIFITFWNGYIYTKYQHSKHLKKTLIINVLSGMLSLLIIDLNPEIHISKWLLITVLGLLYNSFFLEKFVRNIPLLKVFYVGFTWALVCSWLILPVFSWPVFLISWLFVTALVLPFDIRDMDDDAVVTFPKIIGATNTKYLAYSLISISLLASILWLKIEFSLAFFLTSVFTFVLIYFSENTNRDVYFSFWVELCSALPFLFVALMHYF